MGIYTVCVAKKFVSWNRERHCHSACAVSNVKTTDQAGIFLVVGTAGTAST